METTKAFSLEASAYTRDISVLRHYVEQVAHYISIQTGDDYERARQFVLRTIKDKNSEFAIKDPQVRFLERQPNGDREERFLPMTQYLAEAIGNENLIAPTLTTYISPKVLESPLVKYVENNIKKRGVAKKAMFKAKMEKNFQLQAIKNNEQKNAKLANNAMSGGHVSSSTPLFNKTSHSTLTSACRSTSGYGNANNEKLISGNRHYWCYDLVINNITSIITHTDYPFLKQVIEKYQLKYPTVEDVFNCIIRSTRLYWKGWKKEERIRAYLEKLTPIQRAAFLYTGDLYHLMKHNPEMIREFLTAFSKVHQGKFENPKEQLNKLPEEYVALAKQICSTNTKGKKNEDFTDEDADLVTSTAQNAFEVTMAYKDFIKAFFITKNMPASMAYFPTSIRRSALTSDTDSTIFTVQDWVEWYFGKVIFTPESMAIASSVVFIASQTITHMLAMMSANFGIIEKKIFAIAMKNEFMFEVFVPTQVGKHYFASISSQEGNVYEVNDTEIKGVHLKSSNVPKVIMKQAKAMMEDIMNTVKANKKLSLVKYLKEVADIERGIIAGVSSGHPTYFKLIQINGASSYKKSPEESPYLNYEFWNEIFGPKYGFVEEPPYNAIKMSVNLDNTVLLNEWILAIKDKELAKRFQQWLIKRNKKKLSTVYLPYNIIKAIGIPEEFLEVVNLRRIVYDNCKVFYLILETLGYYISNKKITRLVSDFY